jgi:hypothetical protein
MKTLSDPQEDYGLEEFRTLSLVRGDVAPSLAAEPERGVAI